MLKMTRMVKWIVPRLWGHVISFRKKKLQQLLKDIIIIGL